MTLRTLLTAVAAATLVACGGGGGGGGGASASTAPAAVQITEANAKPVGAHATATAQDPSATESTGMLAGVQVDGGEPAPHLHAIASLVRRGAAAADGTSMAAGVSVDDSVACSGGGSIRISGSVSGAGLVAGDSVTLQASNCTETVDGAATTMNGSLTLSVASGSIPDTGLPPFHIVLAMTANNLSVKTPAQTSVVNGDLRLDWSETSSTSNTLTASGSALTSSLTTASGTRSTTLRNYAQSITTSGATVTGTMSASVESSSTVLGTAGGSYTLSTPTSLVWSTSNPNPVAGVVKVVGAGNSQLLVTYSANQAVITIDANGDGNFEKTVTTTAADLKGLL